MDKHLNCMTKNKDKEKENENDQIIKGSEHLSCELYDYLKGKCNQ